MEEGCYSHEEPAADNTNEPSDLSGSEDEEEQQEYDCSVQKKSDNGHTTNTPATDKSQQHGEDSKHQSRKRKRSSSEQLAAEVKRMKESKLKHNKNEQLR